MIITRAPYRISFFGGGTDYPEWFSKNGGSFLSLSINKYAYIALRVKPAFVEKRYRVSWRLQEDVTEIGKIKHPIVRESLLHHGFNDGLDITYLGDLPSGTGLGSSSAFTVALNHALLTSIGKNSNAKDLSSLAYFIERDKLKEVIGIQDQIATAYGGFNKVKINKDASYELSKITMSAEDEQEFVNRCVLVFTGINRRASSIAEQKVKNFDNKSEILKKMTQKVNDAYEIIKQQDYISFGKLLHENWLLKKSLSNVISNTRIDEMYDFAIENGAKGGKLLGAGSGGFLLFFCDSVLNKNKLQSKFSESEIVNFEISKSGSEIILNDKCEKNELL